MKRKIIADLHTHSTASDGDYSPFELIEKVNELNYEVVSLTDHDTVAGVNEAIESGKKHGIQVIPGVEATIRFLRPNFKGSLHVILYFTEQLFNDTKFINKLNSTLSQGRGPALVKKRVEKINKEFGPDGKRPVLKKVLTEEEIFSYGSNITRRHFNKALQEKHGIKGRKTLRAIIGNDSLAYIPSGIDISLLSEFLNRFPQVVRVLAHPAAGSFPGESHYKEVLPSIEIVEGILSEFLDPDKIGLDGLEVFYPGHTLEHIRILLDWSQKYNLIVTGGSDCHDSVKRPLGVEGSTRDELDKLIQLLDSK